MSGNRRLDHPTLSTHPLSHITTGSTNIPLLFLPWANQRTLHLLRTMTPCLQQATLSRNYTSLFILYLHHYLSTSLLSRMLEDPAFQSVVSWGPQGDCFVVKVCHSPTLQSSLSLLILTVTSKDMNEFTKSILPRMFKHSNFASFVRQLNKYDFHKVKNTDDNQFGEHVRLLSLSQKSRLNPYLI